ncbi:alpha/beta hydrolase [Kutzneria viridogrisea]|uniref:Pimeloyl-ACP methyl ester carboxylesterase n=1 Tax=Kutzneria viridogrisea TaxID=47990 RepID=A0ABR6B936_9PSEU|nr:pimeloyl-ACP methyl ester carboxylesterase [Kutzneria viridogrisea]
MGMGRFVSPAARAEFDAAYRAGMALLPEPTETRDVHTGFGTVRVYQFGSAEAAPLVLLPGRASTSVIWQPNLAGLTARHPVYTVEPLGEPGRSEQTAPLRGGADQAAWLGETLAGLGLDRAHLVGHSIGGWLAANLAARDSSRLASVSLLDPMYTLGRFPAQLLLRTALAALPVVSRWGRPSFQTWVNGGVPAPPDDPLAAVIDAGMRTYRMAMAVPEYPTDAHLRSIDIPALVLVAGRSVMHHPRAAYTRARALIPGVQAELWPTATHSLPAESPEEVNARLLRFIAEMSA